MLKLTNITKTYDDNEPNVTALKGLSISFRKAEFVAVLGPSGCGKTTLLNIIGGLDKYTSGDLVINHISTKAFSDKDWDTYRNHSIGFVFQNYNLIPHQTVLANVELALTLSGVNKTERRKLATDALHHVGLGDQLKKKPNQLSGGQMQRVAIARALVNNPDIILADEPTGALDSTTSIQVMDILKDISKKKLVIMVTHNDELAKNYATRTVHMKDGLLMEDSSPYTTKEASNNDEIISDSTHTYPKKHIAKSISMSHRTAFLLSLNNLFTKKVRTILTSFAGSIGIIGIALILSLSNGVNAYIDTVQQDTLTAYPISIDYKSTDMLSIMTTIMNLDSSTNDDTYDNDRVYSNNLTYDVFNQMNGSAFAANNLTEFKKFVDSNKDMAKYASDIVYTYDIPMPIYTTDVNGSIIKTDVADVVSSAYGGQSEMLSGTYNTLLSQINIWGELSFDKDGNVSPIETNQYELIYGSWPASYDEVVLVVNEHNAISDLLLYAMGLKDTSTLPYIISKAALGEKIEMTKLDSWSFEEICQKDYKLILPAEHYLYNESDGSYNDVSLNLSGLEYLYNNTDIGLNLKISGIIRVKSGFTRTSIFSMGYTSMLTEYVLSQNVKNEILVKQLKNKNTNVLTGLPFSDESTSSKTDAQKVSDIKAYVANLTNSPEDITLRSQIYTHMKTIPDAVYLSKTMEDTLSTLNRSTIEEMVASTYANKMGVDVDLVEKFISSMTDEELNTQVCNYLSEKIIKEYATNMREQLDIYTEIELSDKLNNESFTDEKWIAAFNEFTPEKFSATSYEESLKALGYIEKDSPTGIKIYTSTFEAKNKISEIIANYNEDVDDELRINYTDYVGLLMSSVTDIISGISSLLIAFIGIALLVSSIMIGIITYISVLERTREIGILRAIGASKPDISNVFNAETLLIGFAAGFIGILFTSIINIPISLLIQKLSGLDINSSMPAFAGIMLILISMLLTFIAGLIPSKIAAKLNPVVALRSE